MINQEFIGHRRLHLARVDSTNNYTKQLLRHSVISSGFAVSAGFQTEGRGQRGNQWSGAQNENVYVSIFMQFPNLSVERQFDINRWVSLAIAQLCTSYFPQEEVAIKWPNDVYVNSCKIAGILTDCSVVGSRIDTAIIGIGINVNDTHLPFPNATSMKLMLGQEVSLECVYDQLFEKLNVNYTLLQMRVADLRTQFEAKLFRKGVEMSFETGDGQFRGCIKGTTPEGMLTIESGGELRFFGVQEVRYLL